VRIPERVTNQRVTFTRALLGAVSGFVGYIFFQSGLFKIINGGGQLSALLAVSFIFGYTGERLVSKVARAAERDGTEKST